MLFRNLPPRKQVYAKVSANTFEETDFDTYEMWAQYLQEVCDIYARPITNEKMSSLVTVKSRETQRQANLERIMKPLKEIQSQKLFQNYDFWVSVVETGSGKLVKHNAGHNDDLTAAIQKYEKFLKANYINKDLPIEALFYVKEAGAISCSADMHSRVCQRMVGEALRSYNLGRSSINPAKPVYMSFNTPEHESRYFAVIKDLSTEEVKKYNLTLRDQAKAVSQFEKLTAEPNKIGALGFNGMPGNPRWVKFEKHNGTSADIDVALAQFAQQKLARFTGETPTIESIGLLTKVARDAEVASVKQKYAQNQDRMISLAQNVNMLATKNKGLAQKYLKPLVVSVFSYQGGAKWEAQPSTAYPFKHQHIGVWSYSQLLTQVSRRIYALSNLAKRTEPISYAKDTDGRADNLKDSYTHIVMQSVGMEPRMLLASENITDSHGGQILLGYIYRSLDPSGTDLAWWKGGRANFLKYHAFKYTKKVVRTEDNSDYFKVFSILENRDDGQMSIVPCKDTESKNDAAKINAAQRVCLTQF